MAMQLLLFGVPGAAIPVRPVCVAVRDPRELCPKCEGTGVFRGNRNADSIEPGDPDAWICFPCRGKGFQTAEDKARTRAYWALNPRGVNQS
jgi:hypothetical protein